MLEHGTERQAPEVVGKYEVLGLLGRGGMAEVFLCRRSGLGGFNKEVVIKRILPHRVDDPIFVQMFLEEARLAANLSHPNVVQVFEIDEAHGIPYIVMEYVRGPTLATLLRQLHQPGQQQRMHFGHIAKIVAGVCAGLHHAHSAVGVNGGRLGIVHRDVSPQNILISADGVPKILDFGVAKAHGRAITTEVGMLKGKLRYMAPERLQSAVVDHRADIFSVGVVLYEATTGQSPFGQFDQPEFELIRSLLSGSYRKPSEFVPDYPRALEQVLQWAMSPDLEWRCPSADLLRQALEDFTSHAPHVSTQRALAGWVHELVPTKLFSLPIQPPRARSAPVSVPFAGHEALRLSQSGVPHQSGTLASADARSLHERMLEPMTTATANVAPSLAPAAPSLGPPAPARSAALKWGTAAVIVLAAGVFAFVSRPKRDFPTNHATAITVNDPSVPSDDVSAERYLDEAQKLMEQKRFALAAQLLAKAREVRIDSPELNIRLLHVDDELRMQSDLRRARALLDQGKHDDAIEAAKEVLDRAPDNQEALDMIAHARRARAPLPASDVTHVVHAPRHERSPGHVFVTSNVPGMVYLDDDPIGRTPINDRSIAPGSYTLQLRAQGHKPYEAHVVVTSGKRFSLEATLTPDSASAREGNAARTAAAQEVARKSSEAPAPAVSASHLNSTSTSANVPASTPAPPLAATGSAPAASSAAAVSARPLQTVERDDGSIVSIRPKARVPPPHLPREYITKGPDDPVRVCRIIESQAVRLAGVSPEYANGITALFLRDIGSHQAVLHPVALYYFIVSEAGRGHDKKTAAAALLSMREDSPLRAKMSTLPAVEQEL